MVSEKIVLGFFKQAVLNPDLEAGSGWRSQLDLVNTRPADVFVEN